MVINNYIMYILKNTWKGRQGGSLLVDAACSFPVFIMALCLLLSLLNHVETEENTVYAQVQNALSSENSKTVTAVLQITDLQYSSERVPFKGAFDFFLEEEYVSKKFIAYRSFSGASTGIGSEGGIVYVFPKRGERYHRAGCECLEAGSAPRILNAALRKKCQPCQLCHPELLPEGASVYLYSSGSKTYHRDSCSIITKTYESMSLAEAQEKGYTPCMLCLNLGGGYE